MRLIVVNLCARSAHTRPRTTTLSHVDTWASMRAARSARNRATFSIGDSILCFGFGGGALVFDVPGKGRDLGIDEGENVFEAEARRAEGLE